MIVPLAFLDSFSGAFDFIFSQQESLGGGTQVGGLGQVGELMLEHVKVSGFALAVSLALALPLGVLLGHRGTGELFAIAAGNAGRAVPELALIALLVAFVGVHQVDREAVEAARGMGMSERQIAVRVELPLAAPTIMTGVRTSAINIIATATIAPLAGVLTLGDFILSRNVYGDEGVLAGAILVALLALTVELTLAAVQWALTPRGVRLQRTEISA